MIRSIPKELQLFRGFLFQSFSPLSSRICFPLSRRVTCIQQELHAIPCARERVEKQKKRVDDREHDQDVVQRKPAELRRRHSIGRCGPWLSWASRRMPPPHRPLVSYPSCLPSGRSGASGVGIGYGFTRGSRGLHKLFPVFAVCFHLPRSPVDPAVQVRHLDSELRNGAERLQHFALEIRGVCGICDAKDIDVKTVINWSP